MGSQTFARSTPAQTPSQDDLVTAGLDAAFAAALLQQNPLAVRAAAGVLDNSMIAAALGLGGGRNDGRVATTDRAEAREGEADRGRDDAQERIDGRGVSEDGGEHPADGSGEHGRLDPTLADQANHAFWRGVAVGAEGMGMVNAARHMHHFLDNSGAQLDLDLDILEASCSVFAENVQLAQEGFIEEALEVLDGADTTLAGAWESSEQRFTGNQSYFTKGESPDWFFAVGGNTHVMTGDCTYTPDPDGSGHGTLSFTAQWQLTDRYNWDGGKSVDIMGVTVNDEVLGRLHVVGLAQEYDIRGARDDTFTAAFVGQAPGDQVSPNDGEGGRGGEPRTGRDDHDRDRQ
ncbi:MAG: hypothetical protein IPN01_33045 [Deltaproteobacteria bacterium]|nr:hypothetical protein [Deltaproteobacteria bacterium]